MQKYILYNYDQHSMVVINYKDQLQPGTFELAIHFLIENKLDLTIFYPIYKSDIESRYKRLEFSEIIYDDNIIVTADTNFANEGNMKYLIKNNINRYIPDSRDPKFKDHKTKYKAKTKNKTNPSSKFTTSDFKFDAINLTCTSPTSEKISFRGERTDKNNNVKLFLKDDFYNTDIAHLKHAA